MDASSNPAPAPSPAPPRRLFLLFLAGIVLITGVLISFLAHYNRPTLVEMKVTAKRAWFVALPPIQAAGEEGNGEAEAPAAIRRISLFPRELEVEAMEVKDPDCVETTLDGVGPVALQAEPGGSIVVARARETDRLLRPELVLNEPTSLDVEIVGRDKVTVRLTQSRPAESLPAARPAASNSGRAPLCADPGAESHGWSGSLLMGLELSLRLRHVLSAGPAGYALADLATTENQRVSPDAARFRIAGGRRNSQFRLALPHQAGPSAVLRVLDPATGEVSPPTSVPIVLSEPRSFPWQDRLVLLDPAPDGERSVPLLKPDLKIRDLAIARRVQLEVRSFLVAGEVRFPAGEKESVKLEPGAFVSLTVDDARPLTLRSLELADDKLHLLLWGEPTSLRIGPTPELTVERLPSYFEWLVKHQLSGLIYGTLGYVLALSLTVFKLLGWTKG